MSAFCNDCGFDTEPWPPHKGTQEHYIVRDEIWQQAGMAKGRMSNDTLEITGGGLLCVGCIEKRLGRLLVEGDFKPITLQMLKEGCQSTPRLLSRVGVAFMNIVHRPLPEHIANKWAEVTLTNMLRDTEEWRDLVKVDIEGDAVLLVIKDKDEPEGFSAVKFRAGPKLKDFIASVRRDEPEEGSVDLLAWED